LNIQKSVKLWFENIFLKLKSKILKPKLYHNFRLLTLTYCSSLLFELFLPKIDTPMKNEEKKYTILLETSPLKIQN